MLLSVEETPKLSTNHEFAFDLLKEMHTFETGEINFPKISKTKEGKPFFEDSPYHFNISHSENKVAVALGFDVVGVDIQMMKTPSQKVISRVCSQNERVFLDNSGNISEAFTLLWVGKEAYFKENGLGIGSGKKLVHLEILPTFLQGQTGFEKFCNLEHLNNPEKLLEELNVLNLQQNKIQNKHLLRFSKDNFCVGICTEKELKSIKLFSLK